MLVGVGLLESGAEFVEQGAAVGVAFELIGGLPSHIESGVAAGHIADEAAAALGRGEGLDEIGGPAPENQVGDDALLVQIADALV